MITLVPQGMWNLEYLYQAKISIKSRQKSRIMRVMLNHKITLVDGVVLTNTCENCSVKFVPKNNMTCEVWCEPCIGKK